MLNHNRQILICTVSSRLNKAVLLAENAFKSAGIRSLISCQTFEDIKVNLNEGEHKAFSLVFTSSKGLSKNRNNALLASNAKYVWIMDDDVEILAEGATEAFKALEDGPFQVITSRYITDGNLFGKNYKNLSFTHNRISVMKVTSFEIMCCRERLLEKSIHFDEHFGLGAEFISGEENIFLYDCLKAGLNVGYLPISTAFHKGDTSGGNYRDKLQLISKGAIIRRIYGVLGWPLVVAFFLKRLKNKELAFSRACFAVCQGTIGFLKVRSTRQ